MRNLNELDIRHFGSAPPSPPSLKRIGDLEKKVRRKLPSSYIELLQFSNGGSPLNSRFNESGLELEIDCFFSLHESLNELDESKEKQILANIGRGIYIPAEIKSKELIVEIGKGNFVKKSIPETMKTIIEQIEKLNSAKQQIMGKIEEVQMQMNGLIGVAGK